MTDLKYDLSAIGSHVKDKPITLGKPITLVLNLEQILVENQCFLSSVSKPRMISSTYSAITATSFYRLLRYKHISYFKTVWNQAHQ